MKLGIGFGIGSSAHGDWLGRIIEPAGEVVEGAIVFRRMKDAARMREPGIDLPAWSSTLGDEGVKPLVGVRRIWDILRPIRFAALKRVQLANERITIDIAPSISPSADRRGFDLGVVLVLRCALD